MKNLTWQNPEQLFVAQELINKVKSKCCGIKEEQKSSSIFEEDYNNPLPMQSAYPGMLDTGHQNPEKT